MRTCQTRAGLCSIIVVLGACGSNKTAQAPVRVDDDATRRRVYVAADFRWDRNTRPYKAYLVDAVNRVTRENAGCRQVDPASLTKSYIFSGPNKPIFSIICSPFSRKAFKRPYSVHFDLTGEIDI